VLRGSQRFVGVVLGSFFLLRLLVAPPLHLFFDPVESMGPSSVYVQGMVDSFQGESNAKSFKNKTIFLKLTKCVPLQIHETGAGFSGFWFHLGRLQSIPNLRDHDFYCYSSGCLSKYSTYKKLFLVVSSSS